MKSLALSLSAANPAPTFAVPSRRTPAHDSPAARRAILLIGCFASVAAAAWLGEPAAMVRADPELAYLLRGMAAIKAAIVLAAVGVLLWRLGRPLPQRIAAAYAVGAWLIAGSSMLIWQLSLIPLAAVAFHVGEFTLLFAAWRDHRTDLAGVVA